LKKYSTLTDNVKKKLPNFLIVMADQYSAYATGVSGYHPVKTPCLDKIAAEGMVFTNAYAAYPMCTPARASFMTGLYTPQHRVWELGDPLSSSIPTWAHALKHAGYRTVISGRMHFVGDDQLHGFENHIYPESNPVRSYGFWDNEKRSKVMLEAIGNASPVDDETAYQRHDRNVCEAAIRKLDFFARDKKTPFALMVGFILPHFPFKITHYYYNLYRNTDIPLPEIPPDSGACEDFIPEIFRSIRQFLGLSSDGVSDHQVIEARRCYYAMVSFIDEQIGKLLAELERLGLDEDTYFIFLSDHGESLGEHGLWSKLTFFEHSIRIPLIVRTPDRKSAGKFCNAPVSQIDFMPTFLDLTGQLPWLEPLPGKSLLPLFENPQEMLSERIILADYASVGITEPIRMVRYGDWKACFGDTLPPALFNLKDDPGEWKNLASKENFRRILKKLHEFACADGWNPSVLKSEILKHQRRLRYISECT